MGADFKIYHHGTMTKAEYDRFVENTGRPPTWHPHHSHKRQVTMAHTPDTIDADASATMIA